MSGLFARRSARVNVSVLYQFFDSANRPWPTSVPPRRLSFRSGSAWLGRSQKDGLPICRGGRRLRAAVQGHRLARRGGSLVAAPFNRGREWTPRRATLFCSLPCDSSAQAPPGFPITLFWARYFLRSV